MLTDFQTFSFGFGYKVQVKDAEKTFALDTEHPWTVTVQYLCRVKKISMTSNVLPLKFATSQAS